MTTLIQLSAETRAVLADAYPADQCEPVMRRSDLPRTARAARELLWRSHREELGYYAAARAYLMEFESAVFSGLGYSAVDDDRFRDTAERHLRRAPRTESALIVDDRTPAELCAVAYALRPTLANRIRLGVISERRALLGDQSDWQAAYAGVADPPPFIAVTAQNAGLLDSKSGLLASASDNYLAAFRLEGRPGDLVLAAVLASGDSSEGPSGAELSGAVESVLDDPECLAGVRSVLLRVPTAQREGLRLKGEASPVLRPVVREASSSHG